MSSSALKIQTTSKGIVTLTLSRPSRRNALDRQLVLTLGDALLKFGGDPTIRVIVLTGEGEAFCSGADLSSMSTPDPQTTATRIDEFHRLIEAIVSTDKTVLAVVPGPAVGFGADLALACDLRLFCESAYLEESFVKIGLMPDGGGTHFMRRFAGPRAFELLAFGSRLDANSCLRLGIANWVVPADALESERIRITQRLLSSAPLALAEIKKSLRSGEIESLKAALAREKVGQSTLLQSSDFQEGLEAFLQKRHALFQGK